MLWTCLKTVSSEWRAGGGSTFRADTCALPLTLSISTEVSKKLIFLSLIFRVLEVQIFVLIRALATALQLRALDISV